MRIVIILAILSAIIMMTPACSPKRALPEPVCGEEHKEELSKFVLECIRGANPKSDEEPEDWIRICQQMGERVVCPKVPHFRVREGDRWVTYPCSMAQAEFEKKLCPDP